MVVYPSARVVFIWSFATDTKSLRSGAVPVRRLVETLAVFWDMVSTEAADTANVLETKMANANKTARIRIGFLFIALLLSCVVGW